MRMVRVGLVGALLAVASYAWGIDGLVAVESPHSPKDTMDRLEALLKREGLTIFARIDHAAGAARIGQVLRPTEVLIFGSPRDGTPFMRCAQTVGIDLPLKTLVWQSESGQVWLGYNDPSFLAQRHGAAPCPVTDTLRKALAGFAQEAVAP